MSTQEEARKFVEEEHACTYITGQAGTGKSFLLNTLIQDSLVKNLNFAVLASTGAAAVNIGGQTVHSFFKFSPRTTFENLMEPLRALRSQGFRADRIFIDEVSMVRADLMDQIDLALRYLTGHPELPFGGVQMVFIGDLFQLSPVVKDDGDKLFIRDKYDGIPYFFQAGVFKEHNLHVVELTKVYRQKDPEFIDMLNSFRYAKDIRSAIQKLNQRINKNPGPCVTLTTTNKDAARINAQALQRLDGSSRTYTAEQYGHIRNVIAPELLELKIGSRVMLCRNDGPQNGNRWVNGSCGFVEELGDATIGVKLDNGNSYHIHPASWESVRNEYDPVSETIERRVVGEFKQFPLLPADAITIHKSQGATMDRVHIDLGRGAFAHGQLYVALSRCTSIQGLSLARPVTERDVILDKSVLDFHMRIS